VGVVNLAVVACIFRAKWQKGRQVYRGKKCTPRENPRYIYAVTWPGI